MKKGKHTLLTAAALLGAFTLSSEAVISEVAAMSALYGPPWVFHKTGDVNMDDALNASDLSAMLDIMNGANTDFNARHLADINADGEVDSEDKKLLLYYLIGKRDNMIPLENVDGQGDIDFSDYLTLYRAVRMHNNAAFADLNEDGVVDEKDLDYLARVLEKKLIYVTHGNPETGTPPTCIAPDVDGNGKVDRTDLEALLECIHGYTYDLCHDVTIVQRDVNRDSDVTQEDVDILIAFLYAHYYDEDDINEAYMMAGDLNRDDKVDYEDFQCLQEAVNSEKTNLSYDLTQDGVLDEQDIGRMAEYLDCIGYSRYTDADGKWHVQKDDVTGDGIFQISDLKALYLELNGLLHIDGYHYDVNFDGEVNRQDYLDLEAQFGCELEQVMSNAEDVNMDFTVDQYDFEEIANVVNSGELIGDEELVLYDVNRDGKVDDADVKQVFDAMQPDE